MRNGGVFTKGCCCQVQSKATWSDLGLAMRGPLVTVWRVKAGLSLTGVRERFSERVDLTSY